MGLQLNIEKTQNMVFNWQGRDLDVDTGYKINAEI